MGGAILAQFIRRWDNSSAISMFVVVLLMALFVAYGRFAVVPFA
jgi:hypothetical protein